MAKIKEINGNIFNSTCQTVVNTVNCVGVMGKGIALEYKLRYPEMYDSYKEICENQLLKPGLLQLWTRTTPWILNFPTKVHWKYPSKMKYIEAGLEKFVNVYMEKNISSISFPILGSSSGGLVENEVIEVMFRYLSPLRNIEIEIYHFDPDAEDNLFSLLYQKIYRFDASDYEHFIGIKKAQANKIIQSINNNQIHSMLALQNVRGVGEKSLRKIYGFLNNDAQRIRTSKEVQLSLL